MRERELRERAVCAVCRKPIEASGLPLFYVLTIERHGVKLDAVRRQTGLTMMLDGHAALAAVMGPDEEMTECLMGPVTITVCETCACTHSLLYHLAELGEKEKAPDRD